MAPMQPVGKMRVRLSVIVTTYNNPRTLSLVLASIARQTVKQFELLIADDGSGPETRALVKGFAARAPVPVRHIWHPDDGFRKWAICNQAVLRSEGDYIVFFDGDVLVPRRCLEQHVKRIRRDTYLTGGKIDLKRPLADRVTVGDIEGGMLDGIGFWWRHVGRPRRLVMSYLPGIRYIMNELGPSAPDWGGENSSAFKEHIVRIGGFDERFSHGWGDVDFGRRLQVSGVRGRSIRYNCPVFHLDHPRPYAHQEQRAVNRALYEQNRAQGVVRTAHGIPLSTPATAP